MNKRDTQTVLFALKDAREQIAGDQQIHYSSHRMRDTDKVTPAERGQQKRYARVLVKLNRAIAILDGAAAIKNMLDQHMVRGIK